MATESRAQLNARFPDQTAGEIDASDLRAFVESAVIKAEGGADLPSHTHGVGDITGLQTALDLKADASATLLKSGNLSGLANVSIARSNLGLGTAATQASTAFAAASHSHSISAISGGTPLCVAVFDDLGGLSTSATQLQELVTSDTLASELAAFVPTSLAADGVELVPLNVDGGNGVRISNSTVDLADLILTPSLAPHAQIRAEGRVAYRLSSTTEVQVWVPTVAPGEGDPTHSIVARFGLDAFRLDVAEIHVGSASGGAGSLHLYDSVNDITLTLSAGDLEIVASAAVSVPSLLIRDGGDLQVISPDGAVSASLAAANNGTASFSGTGLAAITSPVPINVPANSIPDTALSTSASRVVAFRWPGVKSGDRLLPTFPSITQGGAAVAASTLYLVPVPIHALVAHDRIGLYINWTGSNSGSLRFGVWDVDSNGLPGALLLDAGLAAYTSSFGGELTRTINWTPSRLGWVYLGVCYPSTQPATVASGSLPTGAGGGYSPGAWTGYQTASGFTVSAQNPANAFGSLAGATLSPTSSVPALYLRRT